MIGSIDQEKEASDDKGDESEGIEGEEDGVPFVGLGEVVGSVFLDSEILGSE